MTKTPYSQGVFASDEHWLYMQTVFGLVPLSDTDGFRSVDGTTANIADGAHSNTIASANDTCAECRACSAFVGHNCFLLSASMTKFHLRKGLNCVIIVLWYIIYTHLPLCECFKVRLTPDFLWSAILLALTEV